MGAEWIYMKPCLFYLTSSRSEAVSRISATSRAACLVEMDRALFLMCSLCESGSNAHSVPSLLNILAAESLLVMETSRVRESRETSVSSVFWSK